MFNSMNEITRNEFTQYSLCCADCHGMVLGTFGSLLMAFFFASCVRLVFSHSISYHFMCAHGFIWIFSVVRERIHRGNSYTRSILTLYYISIRTFRACDHIYAFHILSGRSSDICHKTLQRQTDASHSLTVAYLFYIFNELIICINRRWQTVKHKK